MVFSFFGSFASHFQIEHTWLKSLFHICNYEWAKIPFVDGGLDSKFQHCGPCKIPWKQWKASHLDCSGHIKGYIMQKHSPKEKGEKKWKRKIL
jgi:hypothetical protein